MIKTDLKITKDNYNIQNKLDNAKVLLADKKILALANNKL